MRKNSSLAKVGEIAKLAGVLPSTVRYYTLIGLIEPQRRTRGKHKLYKKDETVQLVKRIQNIEHKQLSLKMVKQVLDDHRDKEF